MNLTQTAAMCIVGSILCLFLREVQRPQAALLGLGIIAAALLTAMPEVQRIVQIASNLYGQSGMDGSYFTILCKAVGITYLTQLGGDVCRDCGEGAVGSAVELCGRVGLVVLALPLFVRLAEIVLEVMG